MTTWTTDDNGANRYAPRLQYPDLRQTAAIGHGGSGISYENVLRTGTSCCY